VIQILGAKPKGVVYVPIDFDKQTLEGVLKKAGYAETQKTFFVWEGVTMYITEQGVDNTLRYIAHHSGPGSSVVFDYVFHRVIEGDVRDYECSRARARAAYRGEPWTFGIPEGEANRYVEERGLRLLSDLTAPELARMYLIRTDGSIDGEVFGCGRILHSSVPITTSKGQ